VPFDGQHAGIKGSGMFCLAAGSSHKALHPYMRHAPDAVYLSPVGYVQLHDVKVYIKGADTISKTQIPIWDIPLVGLDSSRHTSQGEVAASAAAAGGGVLAMMPQASCSLPADAVFHNQSLSYSSLAALGDMGIRRVGSSSSMASSAVTAAAAAAGGTVGGVDAGGLTTCSSMESVVAGSVQSFTAIPASKARGWTTRVPPSKGLNLQELGGSLPSSPRSPRIPAVGGT
jgi:hypothetical protein